MAKQTTEDAYQAFKDRMIQKYLDKRGLPGDTDLKQLDEADEAAEAKARPCKHCGTNGEHYCPADLCRPNPTCPECGETDAVFKLSLEDGGPDWASHQCEECRAYFDEDMTTQKEDTV